MKKIVNSESTQGIESPGVLAVQAELNVRGELEIRREFAILPGIISHSSFQG
jgi:hypothetical protein